MNISPSPAPDPITDHCHYWQAGATGAWFRCDKPTTAPFTYKANTLTYCALHLGRLEYGPTTFVIDWAHHAPPIPLRVPSCAESKAERAGNDFPAEFKCHCCGIYYMTHRMPFSCTSPGCGHSTCPPPIRKPRRPWAERRCSRCKQTGHDIRKCDTEL